MRGTGGLLGTCCDTPHGRAQNIQSASKWMRGDGAVLSGP